MTQPQANPRSPAAVGVCGMHRSGTSMVAKLLCGCGLYLGPEADLMPHNEDNPEGFFENLRFVRINEEVLNELGGGWDCPPTVAQGWERTERLGPQREKARELLGTFAGREWWGWKDPRNSLTLPFWKALVPGLKLVVCVRNPLEVALSLHRRNGFSYAFGLSLWREYYLRVLQDTVPEDRVVTHYDAYFRDARGELSRVLGFLGMGVSGEEELRAAHGGASVGMRHNWFGMGHMLEAGVSSEVVRLYASLCQETEWADSALEETVVGGDKLDTSILEVASLSREREVLRRQLEARDAELRDLRERLGQASSGSESSLSREVVPPSLGPTTVLDPPDKGPPVTDLPERLSFRCNICGQAAEARIEDLDREKPSCKGCGSTVRFRSIVHALSMELFGESLSIPDFPTRTDIVGIGMSDWDGYAVPLAGKLGYTNTYYHKEPRLDIVSGDPSLEGTLDFIISSEVFEHVPPPVSVAFENARKLLKPDGVMIFTVPYGKASKTVEHFPDLHDYQIVEQGGGYVLLNTTKDGLAQTFDDLIFHGGPGATLEMRLFSESSLIEEFKAVGLGNVKIYGDNDLDHGVYWSVDWSLPMAVRAS